MSLQFVISNAVILFVNVAIVVQRVLYGNSPPLNAALEQEDELEQALALAED